MSNKAMGWAWDQHDLTPTQKFVLVALCDMANDEDFTCYPSYKHLSVKKTEFTERAIREAVGVLEDKGKIERVRRKKRSNMWRVNYKGEPTAPVKEDDLMGEPHSTMGEPASIDGGTSFQSRGNLIPPESVQEAVQESSLEALHPLSPSGDGPNAGESVSIDFDYYRDSWNAMADRVNAEQQGIMMISRVLHLSKGRQDKIRARLKHSAFDWEAILAKVAVSRRIRSWQITFTFVIESDGNFLKVLEGNYDGPLARQTQAEPDEPKPWQPPGGGFTTYQRTTWQKEQRLPQTPPETWEEFLRRRSTDPEMAHVFADYPLEEAINAYPETPA